jgi:peptide/nickel transport system permease protein
VGIRSYVARRILEIVPVVLVSIIINFLLIHAAPGDPALFLAGEAPDPEYMEVVRAEFGLDRPLYEQLIIYLRNVVVGNLGRSYLYNRPVLELLTERVTATLMLSLTAVCMAILFGIILGVFAAKKYLTKIDEFLSASAIFFHSIPVFWLAIVVTIVFSMTLRWFPVTGIVSVGVTQEGIDRGLDVLWHLCLPVFVLGVYYYGRYFRVSRSSVLEVMREDYVTTARAVGFSENRIFMKYVLRNAILPVVTLAGIQISHIFVGAVLVETVFSWPGLGTLIMDAILSRDYPLIMGSYVIVSVVTSLTSLATDLMYALVDPRVVYK